MQRVVFSALTLAGVIVALSCSSGSDESQAPATLFAAKGCAGCHGADRQGTATAPALENLQRHWDEASLAAYLRDPKAVRAKVPRLQYQNGEYPAEMPAIKGSDDEIAQLAKELLAE
jgi:mono/diheme cytochrome c family protein